MLNVTITAIVTLLLLELSSFLLFPHLTSRSFTYGTVADARSTRIREIRNKLTPSETTRALYQFHPYLGYVGNPGAHPWGESMPPFNEFGMLSVLNHPYPFEKSANQFVIGVVGGSVAEIFANLTEQKLGRYLRDEYGFDKELVLINLATGGYKQPQQLFQVQYALLSGFELDAVLNIDGFNDLVLAEENHEKGINTLFPSGHHIGLMSKTQLGGQLDYQTSRRLYQYFDLYASELRLLELLQQSPLRYSVFLNLVGELWPQRTRAKADQKKLQIVQGAQETMDDTFRGPTVPRAEESRERALDTWQRASEFLYAVCQANNLIYLHVLQPNQYVEGAKPLSEDERSAAINPANRWGDKARAGYPLLIARGKQLKARGVPFYDLTRAFEDVRETLYVDDCCHFGEQGNLILGTAIADILMSELKERANITLNPERATP
ncbi:MAG: hypothetical protein WBO69_18575 [Thermoanaerobaculia bacterium]